MNEQIMQMIQQQPNRITTNVQQSHTHVIKLWDDIMEPSCYQDEIDIIDQATEDDVIVLDICSDGGILDTAALFNRALRSTRAHTVAVIGPSCSSAASVIALSCSEFVLDTTSSLMLHTSSYSIRGKDTDIHEHSTFSRRSLLRLYTDVYSGFLNTEEIADVIKGLPFYFDANELQDRLNNLIDYRDAAEEEQPECDCEDCSCSEDDPPVTKQSFEEMLSDIATQAAKAAVDSLKQEYTLVPKGELTTILESICEDGQEGPDEDGWIANTGIEPNFAGEVDIMMDGDIHSKQLVWEWVWDITEESDYNVQKWRPTTSDDSVYVKPYQKSKVDEEEGGLSDEELIEQGWTLHVATKDSEHPIIQFGDNEVLRLLFNDGGEVDVEEGDVEGYCWDVPVVPGWSQEDVQDYLQVVVRAYKVVADF